MPDSWKKWLLLLLVAAGVVIALILLNPPKPRPRPPVPNSIGGVVWCDDNGDSFPDDGEVGVPSVAVTLTLSSGATVITTTEQPGTVPSDSFPGSFQFRNLATDTYAVEVDEGTLPSELTPPNRSEPPTWPDNIKLQNPGDKVTDVNAGYIRSGLACP